MVVNNRKCQEILLGYLLQTINDVTKRSKCVVKVGKQLVQGLQTHYDNIQRH
jgi:hypothetical protein